MAIKFTPTLFIGLGGTGARALLRTKQCFMDAYGEVPPMIDFLAIDTANSIGGSPIKTYSHGDIALERNETLFITELTAINKYHNFPEEFRWVPSQNVNNLRLIRGEGAGQVRSNGRFILQENRQRVISAIQNKVANINQAAKLGQKYLPATKNDGSYCPAIVNVVGSIAGGTGCGMFVDMLQLIPEALNGKAFDYFVYPWILLPDVYRQAYPKMSDAVYLNAYGAIKELDYLFNLSTSNRNPLKFGSSDLCCLSDRISYAYLINNYNDFAGNIKSPDDMADCIGRSMFLPSNDMGASVSTPMDNIRGWKTNFDLHAGGKSCWCSTSGSAELVYDSKSVGNCTGYALIRNVASQLCEKSLEDITSSVMQWMSSPEVEIQEHLADLLIESILDANCPSTISFDSKSTVSDITSFIDVFTGHRTEEEVKEKYASIKIRVESELNKKIMSILNSSHGVGDAEAFLNNLKIAIKVCVKEMNDENKDHQTNINNHEPWESAIRGIKGRYWGINEEAAEALSNTICYHVKEKRELLRKQYAIHVYEALNQQIDTQITRISNLKNNLEKLQRLMTEWILNLQNDAGTESIYKVNLHAEVIKNIRPNKSTDSSDYANSNKIVDLINAVNEVELFDLMEAWAHNQQDVKSAFKRTLSDVLDDMHKENPEKLSNIFKHLKKMSAPMWKIDYQGELRDPKDIIDIFVIGCDDANNNIIRSHQQYTDIFRSTDGTLNPDFATIGTDGKPANRIQLLTLSCCAPAYAVKNTMSYAREFESMSRTQAGYLDQNWNQRMLSEKFQLVPVRASNGPDPVELWVKAIVLDLVKYSDEKYWIKSRDHGVGRKAYRFDLGANREVAYNTFKSMNIHLEVKTTIDDMVSSRGRTEIQGLFDSINDENYYEEYSKMSVKDKEHIEEDAYKILQDLVDEEIELVSKGLKV